MLIPGFTTAENRLNFMSMLADGRRFDPLSGIQEPRTINY